MAYFKKAKDRFIKSLLGSAAVPRGLYDLTKYFQTYGSINFEYKHEADQIIAISDNFRYGTIITSAKDFQELDRKIKDAILTSFEVPSSYSKEAKIYKEGEESKVYALA